MAAIGRWLVGARRRGLASRPCLLQRVRHSHTQNLWEQLLGKKIKPAVAKALEEAFLEYKVSQSVPSWLPFLPNCSFWIPSSEETMKNLEVLAGHVQEARPARRKQTGGTSFTASPDLWDDGVSSSKAFSAIQVTDKLMDQHEQNPIENGTTILLFDATNKEDEDEDDDDDGDEDEDEDDEE